MTQLIIQLIGLAGCVGTLIWRYPSYKAGISRPIYRCYILLFGSILLSIRPIYNVVDAIIPGEDTANLVLRSFIFLIFFNLGWHFSQAFDSMYGEYMIRGRWGYWVLGLSIATLITSFLLGAKPSEAGLTPSLANFLYVLAWRGYLIYVAIIMLTYLFPAMIKRPSSRLRRIGAGLLTLGCGSLIASSADAFEHNIFGSQRFIPTLLDFTAIISFMLALGLVWWTRDHQNVIHAHPK